MTLPIFSGVEEFAARYDHFIIDIWGVLHDGTNAYPGAAEAMQWLRDNGKQVLLLSNSPNRAARVVQKVLGPIGIPADTYQHILTSGEAAHEYMGKHHAGQRVYTLWDEEVPTALEGLDVTRVFTIDEADFIYASLVPYNAVAESYSNTLVEAAQRGLTMICGNPDRVVVNGGALHICVGTLAEAYENMGGNVVWFGKPYGPIYQEAWEMLGRPDKAKICAIGDGLLTDVGGATGFGCDVVWNLVGIHWDDVQTAGQIDMMKLEAELKGKPRPLGVMHGFSL